MKEDVKYKLYPSVLNSFQRLLDSDVDADDFMNIDRETGEPRQTADEIAASRERDLLDLINHVESAPIEAADKGTAFNEIVDCLIENRKSSRDDLVIRSVLLDEGGNIQPDGKIRAVQASIHGFVFLFDLETCKKAADYYKGTFPQQYVRATINTRYGLVELYGYADYIGRNIVADMKTTSNYSFGKYENGWQKDLYPYCLIESGDMTEVSSFEYTVFQLSGGTSRTPLISAKMYKEDYTYNHAKATARLRQMCERLIEWLEMHRSEITNTKIFGGNG